MTQQQYQLNDAKIKRHLWYLAYHPDCVGPVWQERIDNITDPLLVMARDAILDGRMTDPALPLDVADALADIARSRPTDRMLDIITGRAKPEERPAKENPAAQPARPSIPSFFRGHYPARPTGTKRCAVGWKAKSDASGNFDGAARVEFPNWRGHISSDGEYVPPCPISQWERVLKFCKSIEKASQIYRGECAMRWTAVPTNDAKKMRDRIRKRNQRGPDVAFYTTFTLDNGTTIFLHDAHYIDGQKLPADRADLYSLVEAWALLMPKKRRAGRNLSTWGKMPSSPAKSTSSATPKQSATQSAAKPPIKITGDNYGKFIMALEAADEITLTSTAKHGVKFDKPIHVDRMIEILDAAGIQYEIEGMSHLTDNTKNNLSVKCDIEEKRPSLFDFAGQSPPIEETPEREITW